MRFGPGLPQRDGADLRTDITGVARAAEAAGFDRLIIEVQLQDAYKGGSWLLDTAEARRPNHDRAAAGFDRGHRAAPGTS